MNIYRSLKFRWDKAKLYARYKLVHRDYTIYYSELMDQRMLDGWGVDGDRSFQINFLQKYGLAKHNKFLDFGCGPVSAGIDIIEYLDPGNYYGIDISARAIEEGNNKIINKGLLYKKPSLNIGGEDFFEDPNFSVDYIWAQSVFTHMPPENTLKTLEKFKLLLAPTSVVLATFNVDNETRAWSSGGYIDNNFSYNICDIKKHSSKVGLDMRIVDGWEHPCPPLFGKDILIEFKLA